MVKPNKYKSKTRYVNEKNEKKQRILSFVYAKTAGLMTL